jgi:hypothetical protein
VRYHIQENHHYHSLEPKRPVGFGSRWSTYHHRSMLDFLNASNRVINRMLPYLMNSGNRIIEMMFRSLGMRMIKPWAPACWP